ncbi:MAG TPA: hypothetical protein VGR00_14555, partial [Thermoanaerobaculia bacterium]|nr:hypothetical protein [Thermoanaerobaculia bacterium]
MIRPSRKLSLGAALGAAAACALFAPAAAQTPAPPPAPAPKEMSIEEYEPKSTLVVPEHPLTRAKFPFIDVHNHQEENASAEAVARVVADMDRLNMRVMVNLSGGTGAALAKNVAAYDRRHPGRFVTFANLDFDGID